MQIQDKNKPALIIWGTKRGKDVFFSVNLADSNDALNEQLKDVRGYITLQRGNLEFYSIDFNSDYTALSTIYTLNDALSRIGYLAITVVVDAGKKFRDAAGLNLLKKLQQLYMDRYVVTESVVNKRISLEARENVNLFEQLLSRFNADIIDNKVSYPVLPAKNSTCFALYDDEAQLEEIFKFYNREEFVQYEKVLVKHSQRTDIVANSGNIVTLPPLLPPSQEITCKVIVRDGASPVEPLNHLSLNISLSKSGPKVVRFFEPAVFTYKEDETVSITVTKDGYEDETVNTAKFKRDVTVKDSEAELTIYIRKVEAKQAQKTAPPITNTGGAGNETSRDYGAPTGAGSRLMGNPPNEPAGGGYNAVNQESGMKKNVRLYGMRVALFVIGLVLGFLLGRIGGGGGSASPADGKLRNIIEQKYTAYKASPQKEDDSAAFVTYINPLAEYARQINDTAALNYWESIKGQVKTAGDPNPTPPVVDTEAALKQFKQDIGGFRSRLEKAKSKDKFDEVKEDLHKWWEGKDAAIQLDDKYKNLYTTLDEEEFKAPKAQVAPANPPTTQPQPQSPPPTTPTSKYISTQQFIDLDDQADHDAAQAWLDANKSKIDPKELQKLKKKYKKSYKF